MSIDHSHDLVNMECFDVTYTTDIIRKIVENILNKKQFNMESIDTWSRQIVDSCQKSLSEIYNSFKTIITTMIIPKNDENIHIGNACLWDYQLDGSTIINHFYSNNAKGILSCMILHNCNNLETRVNGQIKLFYMDNRTFTFHNAQNFYMLLCDRLYNLKRLSFGIYDSWNEWSWKPSSRRQLYEQLLSRPY
ncbi:unnamed protein product [Rotaria sp. Silwood1]|nr:unnamed protein product [Rotaria sp. Silwood1]CAF4944596.1 unnamed protein product [Rotaria sp. Silwood1]